MSAPKRGVAAAAEASVAPSSVRTKTKTFKAKQADADEDVKQARRRGRPPKQTAEEGISLGDGESSDSEGGEGLISIIGDRSDDWCTILEAELAEGKVDPNKLAEILPALLASWKAEREASKKELHMLRKERDKILADSQKANKALQTIEKKVDGVQKEMASLKNKDLRSEIKKKDACLILRGIPLRCKVGNENESNVDTKNAVKELLNSMKLDKIKVAAVERLPQGKKQKNSERPANPNWVPAVRLQLADASMKFDIYKALPTWQRPAGLAKLRVQQEYPACLRGINEKLEKEAYELRRAGFKTRIVLKNTTLKLLKRAQGENEFSEHVLIKESRDSLPLNDRR
jgi:hypothetical protein